MQDKSYLIEVQNMVPEGALGWRVDLPPGFAPDEDQALPGCSLIDVLENGKPLGPYHLFEARVERQGGGLFTYRGTRLVFSSSDKSDPRTNGRSYAVALRAPREEKKAQPQEQTAQEQDFPAVPRIVVIDTINTCNAKCPFCPLFHGEAGSCRPPVTMDGPLFESLVKDISQWPQPPGLFWLGMSGEPLMDPLFAERMDQVLYYGLGPRITLQTNGHFLDAAKARAIVEAEIGRVIFGFDGASKNVYEAHRVGCSYERVLENIRQFAAMRDKLGAETSIQIMYIRTPNNQHEVVQAHALFNEFLNEKTDCFEDRLALDWRETGSPPQEKAYYVNKVVQGANPSGCNAARGQMVIHPDGTMAACNLDYNLDVAGGCLGKVREGEVLSVWDSEQRRALDRVLSCDEGQPPKHCQSCPAMYACQCHEPQPCALPELCTETGPAYFFYRFKKR